MLTSLKLHRLINPEKANHNVNLKIAQDGDNILTLAGINITFRLPALHNSINPTAKATKSVKQSLLPHHIYIYTNSNTRMTEMKIIYTFQYIQDNKRG